MLLKKERSLPTKTHGPSTVERYYEAMAHPLRRKAWIILHDREASPKEIADQLGERTDTVSHHVKRLVRLGCAELVRTEGVRGSTIRHVYKALEPVLIDVADWDLLVAQNPPFARHFLCGCMQAEIDDFRASVTAGVLGSDARWIITRTPAVVDDQGLDDALTLIRETEEKFAGIVQESAARRSGTGEDAVPISMFLNVFKTAPR
jgi:DNA-binding transcriptional ArsR family regulator